MRLPPPYPQILAMDETGKMHRGWVTWLRTLFGTLGWAKDVKVYSEVVCTLEDGAYATFDGDIQRPEMADGTTTTIQWAGKLPNDYKNGTDLEPFFEYAPADATSGNIQTQIGYAVASAGSALSEETESKVSAAPGVAKAVARVTYTAITGTSLVKGDAVVGKIQRVGAGIQDSYKASVFALNVGFKYRREGIGHEKAHP